RRTEQLIHVKLLCPKTIYPKWFCLSHHNSITHHRHQMRLPVSKLICLRDHSNHHRVVLCLWNGQLPNYNSSGSPANFKFLNNFSQSKWQTQRFTRQTVFQFQSSIPRQMLSRIIVDLSSDQDLITLSEKSWQSRCYHQILLSNNAPLQTAEDRKSV